MFIDISEKSFYFLWNNTGHSSYRHTHKDLFVPTPTITRPPSPIAQVINLPATSSPSSVSICHPFNSGALATSVSFSNPATSLALACPSGSCCAPRCIRSAVSASWLVSSSSEPIGLGSFRSREKGGGFRGGRCDAFVIQNDGEFGNTERTRGSWVDEWNKETLNAWYCEGVSGKALIDISLKDAKR